MSSFLEIALNCIARGWHVHPLKPGDKIPITPHGKNDATTDEEQIRAWWAQVPNANVGIACGPSGLCVLDIDKGLTARLFRVQRDIEGFNAWRVASGLPETYTVRTGRRPEFGAQMYFKGPIPDVGMWELNGCSGQVKSAGGLVLAAGCLHPSGEYYQPICSADIQPTPEIVRKLQKPRAEVKPGEPIRKLHVGEGRRPLLMAKLGSLFNLGLSRDALLTSMVDLNEKHCADLVPLDILEAMVDSGLSKWTLPPSEPTLAPIATAPAKKVILNWRERYHTKDEMENAPPISFLIEGFLQREGVTGLAGPVRERKSLIALNVTHALLTGEPLFDYFKVVKQPARVLYLCPEVSLGPFTDRLKKIGLMDYVGERLFCRTLSAEGHVSLAELKEELPGSVVVLDTAIRFLEGDENSSTDIRAFADTTFGLLRGGAEAVLLLHHSPKEAGDVMTLENCLRGSGDMGAFLACCWGTKLQDPTKPYESASYLENLKQRDFASEAFDVTCGADCRLHIVGNPALKTAVLKSRRHRPKPGGDAAEELIRANPGLSVRDLVKLLAEHKIDRKVTWVSLAKKRLITDQYTDLQANGGKLG